MTTKKPQGRIHRIILITLEDLQAMLCHVVRVAEPLLVGLGHVGAGDQLIGEEELYSSLVTKSIHSQRSCVG